MWNGKPRPVGRQILERALILLLVVGLPAAFLAGGYLSPLSHKASAGISCVLNTQSAAARDVDFAPFWRAWQIIDQKYVGTATTTATSSNSETDPNARLWGAISGMVDSLGDPYTVFLPPTEKKVFDADIKGSFGGVGIELGVRDRILTAISALEGTPAKRAGVQPGDKILKVDGVSTERMISERAVTLIRGEVGTSVVLTLYREGVTEPFDVKLTRAIIEVPTLETKTLPGNIFVISLYNFSGKSDALFKDAVKKFTASGSAKLIIDLRGNPGGYLDAAVDVSSWFLPAGKVVLREQIGPQRQEQIYRTTHAGISMRGVRMVILIDEGSASASEIVAGALREYGVATLVGERSFGKGSVQELAPVTKETSLKVTIARWLTPLGNSISKEGLAPDITIIPTPEDIKAGRDVQMERAVSFLLHGR